MKSAKKRMIERRKYVRLPVEANVKCKIDSRIVNEVETVKCNNMSPEGLCITSNKPLKKGMLLYLIVTIKECKPFLIRGRVVWAQKTNQEASVETKKTRAGIKILDMDEDDKNRFLLLLCDEMVSRLGKNAQHFK